jgi:hypothetical protein
LSYYNEEAIDDFVGCVFNACQMAMEEGREFELRAKMTDEEIERLDILVSEVDRPTRPPMPWYTTVIVPPGLTEDEALQRALHNSVAHPPSPPPLSFNLWVATPPPPTPVAPTYVPPAANWPWEIPDFVMLGDEDEG